MSSFKLLTLPTGNPKAAKGMSRGVMTFALHLAPSDLSGHEVCPKRTAGCTAGCLNTAGQGGLPSSGPTIQAARIRRTKWYFSNRASFMATLAGEIAKARQYALKRGYALAVRLNATSDIPWHRVSVHGLPNIMAIFPDVQFYDYTKVAKRLISETLPSNYHLTFSLAENNATEAEQVLRAGGNVAVVFRDKQAVKRAILRNWHPVKGLGTGTQRYYHGVVDGDETDLRYLDPKGCIVALYAKGRAKKDTSGFVRDL